MKKIILFIFFFLGAKSFAQTNGITYQAVILNPSGEQLPGVNNSNAPMVGKNICLQFQFIDEFSKVEYQETIQTKTDAFGMVNLLIGSGRQTGGYASSFNAIYWSSVAKKLAVGVNIKGNCTSFVEISKQDFTFVPFAYAAANAENVTGVVPIENGGTNATTLIQAKTNLQLQNVNNTTDSNKPISIAAQSALNLKVDKVAGKGLSTEDYLTAEKTKLGAILGTNTGDQDLSALATKVALNLKVDKIDGKGLSTEDYSTAEKTKLGSISGTNTGDQDLSALATTAATTAALNLKVDKVAGERLINAAEISKLSNQSGINTGDQDLSSFATNSALALKASIDSPTFTGTVSGIDKTMVGLANVDNTTDADKPISTAGQSALDLKANLVSPTFTGTPTAPTADSGTSTTQIATTQFVSNAISTLSVPYIGATASVDFGAYDLKVNGITAGKGNGAVVSNTAFGIQALKENTTGSFNTAFGTDALKSNTTGFLNTAFGTEALNLNTIGARNTAFGAQGLYNNNGNDNTTVGFWSLVSNTTGNYNVALGSEALRFNTTGAGNTAIGTSVLSNNINGSRNTSTGNGSLYGNTSGGGNTASGYYALQSNTTGNYNVAYGAQALEQASTGSSNTAIGAGAIDQNTSGSNNAVLGAFAGRYDGSGNTNTLINNSVLIGSESRPNAINESNQIVIGYGAIGNGSNTVQLGNTAITNVKTSGTLTAGTVSYPNSHNATAGQILTTNASGVASWATPAGGGIPYTGATGAVNLGAYNLTVNGITVGRGVGNDATNTVVGSAALQNNISDGDAGTRNTAIGYNSLVNNTGGKYNTAVGYNVLASNRNGQQNQASGHQALYSNNGNSNTANGNYSLQGNTTGNNNTANGFGAFIDNISGSNNTALGYLTGRDVTTGSGNTILGANVIGLAGGLTNNIILANGTGAIKAQNNGTDWTLTGGLTAGGITYPKVNGTSGQVLTTDGSGVATWATAAAGGSGVDLTTNQTIAGVKTFSSDVIIDGLTVGCGSGTAANKAVGFQALLSNTSGDANTAIGNSALRSNTGGVRNTATGIDAMRNNTSGGENTASGYFSLKANTNGSKNTGTGYESLNSNTSGGRNTGIGVQALRSNSTGSSNTATGNTALDSNTGSRNTASGDGVLFDNTSGSDNTALGFNTGRGVTTGSGNTILGANVIGLAAAITNNIILASGDGVIKAQNDGTNWTMQGTVTAPTFIGALTGTATTATNVSGTVAIANGGTGASTATSAFNALSPMTTAGDIIYGGASGVGTRLAKGLDGQVLTLTSGQPSWAAAAVGIPYTGATQAVNLGAYNLTVNGLTVGLGNGTGGGNTAFGNQALNLNTASGGNTAIGSQALSKNTTGLSNTATGNGALSNHTTGSRNTSFGNDSGLGITTGDNNTAIGASANVTGASTNATAIGYAAIATTSNTIQLGNTSVTNVKTSGTLTAGTVTYPNAHNSTAGQVLTTNAAGTATWITPAGGGVDLTTNQTIGGVKTFSSDMLVNGITVGRGLGSVAGNTSVGELSLKTNTTGYYNSAFGFNALMRNTTGAINTAIGGQSLYNNTTGSANTGIGVKALNDNTTGGGNTAVGYLSLYTNISGNDNTVVGASALNQNTIGKLNAALGVNALYRNISGDNNIAIGSNAMTEGTTNLNNTAVGTEALKNQNASRNTALGYQAGFSIVSGDNNTVIGASTNVTGGSANATAIGYQAVANASNTIQLGNTSVTDVKTSGSITAKSIISSGKTVMGTATIDYSQLNNYDVSNVSILFVRPNSTWTSIYGLSGGVLGQVIHLYSVNDQTSNCCTGLSLYNFDSSSNTGTQKFVAPGGINIDSNKNTTLVFDGTYWRVSKFGM